MGKKRMSGLKWSLVLSLLMCFLNCSASKEENAQPGDDVILQCQGSRDADIKLIEWTKSDLKPDDYVFFFRDNQMYEAYQHPSFRGRVKLRDPVMKNGDVSVILKNVNISDAGTYECYVRKSNSGHSKRSAAEVTSSITLKVEDSDPDQVNARTGENVILRCGAVSNTPITLTWTRPDKVDYVFFYQDRRSDPEKQHPCYKNYVELCDSEMKDGNMSLILKNAMNTDSGKYHCYVHHGETKRRMRSIDLYVHPSGDTSGKTRGDDNRHGHFGLAVGLLVATVLLLVFVGFVIYKQH